MVHERRNADRDSYRKANAKAGGVKFIRYSSRLSQISKAARTLALDYDFAVRRAQFDLSNVTASGIRLFRNQSRARLKALRGARKARALSSTSRGT